MSILIVNQSFIDLFASVFTVLSAVVEVDGTRMSRDSVYDQFVCRVWMSRRPLWSMMTTSTYGILLTALDRYIAVVYPIWYNTHVSTISTPFNAICSKNKHRYISAATFDIHCSWRRTT